MAFKISQSPTFYAPVKAEMTDENGRRVNVSFDMQYKRLTMPELKALATRSLEIQQEADRSPDGPDSTQAGAEYFLGQVAVGWRHVVDEDGEAPFSASGLQTMIDYGLAEAMQRAFLENLPRAREKN